MGRTEWDQLSPEQRQKLINQRQAEAQNRHPQLQSNAITTFSQLKAEGRKGFRQLRNGIVDTTKGITEILIGTAKETDTAALGLGAIAIMTLGLAVSPIPAAISRQKNIIDINKEIARFAQTPKFARLAGYPLLAFAGGCGIWQIQKALK